MASAGGAPTAAAVEAEMVQEARRRHYYMNFLTTEQVARLVKHICSISAGGSASSVMEQLLPSLRVVNTGLTLERLEACPPPEMTVALAAAVQLERSGAWLGQVFAELNFAHRPFPPAMEGAAKNNLNLETDVTLLLVEGPRAFPDDAVLTAYTAAGHLPEWPELLICAADTEWEVVHCFLSRWKGASRNGRATRLYCMSKADLLADRVQREASRFMLQAEKDAEKGALAKLLVVTCTDTGAIFGGLGHRRHLGYNALEMEEEDATKLSLRAVAKHVADVSMGAGPNATPSDQGTRSNVLVYSGPRSGCGKTFALRVEAGEAVDVWAVHKHVGLAELLERAPAGSKAPLHIDVSTTATESLNDLLFQLVVVGCASDPNRMIQVVWAAGDHDGAGHRLLIECSSRHQLHRLRVCDMLPQRRVPRRLIAGAPAAQPSFSVDADELRLGFGEDFDSHCFDGTAAFDSPTAATAAERLQYVCKLLRVLDTWPAGAPARAVLDRVIVPPLAGAPADGIAPEVLGKIQLLGPGEGGFLSEDDVTGEDCHALLVKWSQQKTHPSFVSMWSYVNVLYFMVKTYHTTCAIDKSLKYLSKGFPDMKNKIFEFMSETCLDFAPRPDHDLAEQPERQHAGWDEPDPERSGVPKWESSNHNLLLQSEKPKIGKVACVFGPSPESNTKTVAVVVPRGLKMSCNVNTPKMVPVQFENGELDVRDGHVCRRDSVAEYQASLALELVPVRGEQGEHLTQVVVHRGSVAGTVVATLNPFEVAEGEAVTMATLLAANKYRELPAIEFEITVEDDPTDANRKLYTATTTNPWHFNLTLPLTLSTAFKGGVVACAVDMAGLQEVMHEKLYERLTTMRLLRPRAAVPTFESFADTLGMITGVLMGYDEVAGLLRGRFSLTNDTLLKIIAVYIRARCGIPIVLMGECGCGKTALLRFITSYLGVELRSLGIHGGTTEHDIVSLVAEAEALGADVWVYLDEMNTCTEMGLLTEIVARRRCHGRPISKRITIVGTLYPYRRKTPGLLEEGAGPTFPLHTAGGEVAPDPMKDLVYKVHPTPGPLLEYCFDFGAPMAGMLRDYIGANPSAELLAKGAEKEKAPAAAAKPAESMMPSPARVHPHPQRESQTTQHGAGAPLYRYTKAEVDAKVAEAIATATAAADAKVAAAAAAADAKIADAKIELLAEVDKRIQAALGRGEVAFVEAASNWELPVGGNNR